MEAVACMKKVAAAKTNEDRCDCFIELLRGGAFLPGEQRFGQAIAYIDINGNKKQVKWLRGFGVTKVENGTISFNRAVSEQAPFPRGNSLGGQARQRHEFQDSSLIQLASSTSSLPSVCESRQGSASRGASAKSLSKGCQSSQGSQSCELYSKHRA